jgi:hypothetical protein
MPEFKKDVEDYFKNLAVVIPLFPEENTKEFRSINNFYKFIENEVAYWSDCTEGKTSYIANYFHVIINHLNAAANPATAYDEQINQLNNAVSQACMNRMNCLYSITEAAQKMKLLYERHPLCAEAFYDYLQGNNFDNKLVDRNYLYGVLDSLEAFDIKAETNTIKKKQQLLAELSKRFLGELDSLDKKSVEFKDQIIDWKEHLVTDVDGFVTEKKDALDALEKTYNEKLRLETPAEYWKKLSEEYETKGNYWRDRSLWVGGAAVVILTVILLNLPAQIADIQSLSFASFKSVVILTTIVSIIVYIIRLFVKLATSSYHLARDAKERYQLTYFYLSLINDGKDATESERNIVYNALFSRADTGLLKGDSSPTIPDGATQQFFKMMK